MLKPDTDSYEAAAHYGSAGHRDATARLLEGLRVEAKYMGATGTGGNPDDRPEED